MRKRGIKWRRKHRFACNDVDEDGNCTECLVACLPSVIVLLSDQQMSLVMGNMKPVSFLQMKK